MQTTSSDEENIQPQEDDRVKPGCTCGDKWAVSPCPVCAQKKAEADETEAADEAYAATQRQRIITDESLSPDLALRLVGYGFLCPDCEMGCILHLFNYCPNCGVPVKIQSITVQAAVRKINEQNKKF